MLFTVLGPSVRKGICPRSYKQPSVYGLPSLGCDNRWLFDYDNGMWLWLWQWVWLYDYDNIGVVGYDYDDGFDYITTTTMGVINGIKIKPLTNAWC